MNSSSFYTYGSIDISNSFRHFKEFVKLVMVQISLTNESLISVVFKHVETVCEMVSSYISYISNVVHNLTILVHYNRSDCAIV